MLKEMVIIYLVMLLSNSCVDQSNEKAFIAKYGLEDFSQFKDTDMTFRGSDRQGNFIVFGYAPNLINTSEAGYYVVILDSKNYQVIETELVRAEDYANADMIKLHQLAQTFMRYEISRLNVDAQGSVFIYLENAAALALVRFANESELLKRSKEMKWIKIKDNWYKPN